MSLNPKCTTKHCACGFTVLMSCAWPRCQPFPRAPRTLRGYSRCARAVRSAAGRCPAWRCACRSAGTRRPSRAEAPRRAPCSCST
eukprot:5544605-Prymnesium_polylepis.1